MSSTGQPGPAGPTPQPGARVSGAAPTRIVGIFGGSFNPPHVAHQMVALYVLETEPIDELWMIPTYRHAFAKELVDFEARCRMCELATAALGPRVRISRIEAELTGPKSRTLDTLQALSERYPDTGFRLVIGADILAESHKWYRWDDIVALAPPIVVGRSGHGQAAVEIPPVSSTEIRARLGRGESVAHLVPRAVAAYLGETGLYT